MNLETGSNAPSSELIQGLAVGKASIPKSIYAALRISRDKNKAVILDVYWDCGFLGVKDGNNSNNISFYIIIVNASHKLQTCSLRI